MASTPLALQLTVYVLAILALSTVFFAGFERPILVARPYYGGPGREPVKTVAPHGEPRRFRPSLVAIALGLAAVAAGVLARNAFMADKPYVFYPLLIATALLVLALVERARPLSTGAIAVAARAFLLFALVLPFADALYRALDRIAASRDGRSAHLFLSRRARQSDRLCDLVVLLSQRVDSRGRDKGGDRCAGPAKEAALRAGSGQLGAHVRHDDPHQQSRLPRAGHGAATRATRSALSRSANSQTFGPTLARRREALARTPAGSVRPARLVRPQNSRSSTAEPRPIRSRTISSACAATSCRSSPI